MSVPPTSALTDRAGLCAAGRGPLAIRHRVVTKPTNTRGQEAVTFGPPRKEGERLYQLGPALPVDIQHVCCHTPVVIQHEWVITPCCTGYARSRPAWTAGFGPAGSTPTSTKSCRRISRCSPRKTSGAA